MSAALSSMDRAHIRPEPDVVIASLLACPLGLRCLQTSWHARFRFTGSCPRPRARLASSIHSRRQLSQFLQGCTAPPLCAKSTIEQYLGLSLSPVALPVP